MKNFEISSKNQQIHYFTTNIEYKQLPVNTDFVLSKYKSMKFSSLLFFTQLIQDYCFFLICKVGNDHLYLTGLFAFVIMSGTTLYIGRKNSEVRSKTSLAFMGLLDIIYFYMLLGTGHYLSSFVFATQLQATLFIRVFLSKFILANSFRFLQYLGCAVILAGAIVNLSEHGDRYTYLLLLGMVLHCINGIIKRHYLKKFRVDALAMNKYVLLFATGFGVIITPLLSLLLTEDIAVNLKKEIMCTIGVDCFLMPLHLVLLVLATIANQFVLKKTAEELEGRRIVYMFSAIVSFLGFYLAEITVGKEHFNIITIISAALAITGSIIYHMYPEIPQKFSYSDN